MKKYLMTILCMLLLCTGCNVEQTVNDGLDKAGDIISAGSIDGESEKRDCYDDAKEIIMSQIDTPASAVFPRYDSDDVVVSLNERNDSCVVQSYFDCDNLLGATVRTRYILQINYSDYLGGSDYTYNIEAE